MFNGLGMNLGNLSRLSDAKTRSISAENPHGEIGRGGSAVNGTGAGCACELGVGWKLSPSVIIAPHSVYELADIEGPGAVQSIWFAGTGIDYDAVLRIYWDGSENPSVESPLAAFFGNCFNNSINSSTGRYPTLNSLPVLVAPNRGMNCFWEMPFRRRCRMTLENESDAGKVCYYQINYTLTEVPDDCAYFHAQYRQARPVAYREPYTVADGICGKGHYVGTSLSVGLNSAGGWWGEGEIKFYIDSDGEYPTICGTGTEDYFGGAYNWDAGGKYNTYSGPFMGMFNLANSDGLYASQQRFAMYRWHIMDPVRFEGGLRVTLQDLGWRRAGRYLSRRDDFMSVAYWYQTLPTAEFPPLPTLEEREITCSGHPAQI